MSLRLAVRPGLVVRVLAAIAVLLASSSAATAAIDTTPSSGGQPSEGGYLLDSLGAWAASEQEPSPPPDCADSLQVRIDSAQTGDTLQLPPCVFREAVRVSKAVTLDGSAGTQIRGSDRWSAWSGAGPFTSIQSVPLLPTELDPVICKQGNQRCFWPEQVFLDGVALTQVPSSPSVGQFSVDAQRRIVLADDPNGRLVEVTTRQHWLVVGAAGVSLQGMTMTHAGAGFQDAALKADNGVTSWSVSGSNLSYAHGANVRPWGARLVGNDIHHGGSLGIAGGGFVQGNRIRDNNTEGFNPGWQAGGMKFAFGVGDIIDGNDVYGNDGPGLWCDTHCEDVTFSRNRVHHNTFFGILYEISERGKIYGNAVWSNGSAYPYYGGGAGIFLSSTSETEVRDNVLAWNGGGVHVSNYDRGPEFPRGNNSVHDNQLLMANSGQLALADIEGPGNNRASGNHYWYPMAENGAVRFEFAGSQSSLDALVGKLGPGAGRYLSREEVDQVLRDTGIPAQP